MIGRTGGVIGVRAAVRALVILTAVVFIAWLVVQASWPLLGKLVALVVIALATIFWVRCEVIAYRVPSALDRTARLLLAAEPSRIARLSRSEIDAVRRTLLDEIVIVADVLSAAMLWHPHYRARRHSSAIISELISLNWCYDEMAGDAPDADKERIDRSSWAGKSPSVEYPNDPVERAHVYYARLHKRLTALYSATDAYRFTRREAAPFA